MADSKLTALGEISVPALEDLFYTVDDPAGTPVSNKVTGYRLGGLLTPQICQGRLTTESAVPVSTSNRAAQSTLYWTPCLPNGEPTTSGLVGFYDGTRYVVRSLTELSLNLDTAEAGGAIDVDKNYDVFIDYAAGTPALVIGPAWSSDTARATALVAQGPLVALTGDTDWRWVGTIRASASGDTEDSLTKRFVWNAYNPIRRRLTIAEGTNHTYNNATIRQWNADATIMVEVIAGVVGTVIDLVFYALMSTSSGGQQTRLGVGINTTSSLSFTSFPQISIISTLCGLAGADTHTQRLGYSYYSLNEAGTATGTHTLDDGYLGGSWSC